MEQKIALILSKTIYEPQPRWEIIELLCDPPYQDHDHFFLFINDQGWSELYSSKVYKKGEITQGKHYNWGYRQYLNAEDAVCSGIRGYKLISSSKELSPK